MQTLLVPVKRDPNLEFYFCQAVEYNYDAALKAILNKAYQCSSFVNKDYYIKVGTNDVVSRNLHVCNGQYDRYGN